MTPSLLQLIMFYKGFSYYLQYRSLLYIKISLISHLHSLKAGKGSRMGNVNMPKQFLPLNKRPIIIHTVEKFLLNDRFDKILIVSPKEWINIIGRLFNGKNCFGILTFPMREPFPPARISA